LAIPDKDVCPSVTRTFGKGSSRKPFPRSAQLRRRLASIKDSRPRLEGSSPCRWRRPAGLSKGRKDRISLTVSGLPHSGLLVRGANRPTKVSGRGRGPYGPSSSSPQKPELQFTSSPARGNDDAAFVTLAPCGESCEVGRRKGGPLRSSNSKPGVKND